MRRLPLTSALLLGALAALLTGCSRNPVAPTISMPLDSGASSGLQADDTPPVPDGGRQVVVHAEASADKDLFLSVGRFTLQMKKNALKKSATITMRVTSQDATEVEIEVTPADANDFKKPVTLTADMSDRPQTDYDRVTMWNWKNNAWEAGVNVTADQAQQTVVTQGNQVFNTLVVEPVDGDAVDAEGMRTRNKN